MKILSYSETGLVRRNNEDAYLVLKEQGLLAVADGMGGHLAGEVASRTALNEISQAAAALDTVSSEDLEAWLLQVLERANRSVYESSNAHPEMQGMGTTLTALIIRPREALIGHVGDSRAYLWRQGSLETLTNDHSLVGELLRLGEISEEEAEKHPKRHMLTRAVGAAEEVEVDVHRLETERDDVFLLCTDGFSNMVSIGELTAELMSGGSWEAHLKNLKQLVIERGAPDNFTLLCCILE
ncbi:MAG: Stp1/IreP family PP2C-type Ser/Thr phosphatase [Desulfitobacteriaceae bacterium]|nr:Stp1/IreP family PP2C-type Ser/Thr phosphatase [Desulfitobacteriaceae bacterium]MDI6879882.1 Stp1/IreP family PP2C-type Ser/Thr phosphatase [Desulfitobacteriaceae bacterium]MDI6914720.1 Stp1/IreP family PP2C-type Ser/Thr phosphatase [Desulfitobacteriaceae bacterium]